MTRDALLQLAAWSVVLVLVAAGLWASAAGLALGLVAGRLFR